MHECSSLQPIIAQLINSIREPPVKRALFLNVVHSKQLISDANVRRLFLQQCNIIEVCTKIDISGAALLLIFLNNTNSPQQKRTETEVPDTEDTPVHNDCNGKGQIIFAFLWLTGNGKH